MSSNSPVALFWSSLKLKGLGLKWQTATMTDCGFDHNGAEEEARRSLPTEEEEARRLLPTYLTPYVWHYHEDFYVSKLFHPNLIAQLISEGFLPIATRGLLLPKLHVLRCVLQLKPISKLHISKSTRKKAQRFSISINESFDRVVAGCHRQHGENWREFGAW